MERSAVGRRVSVRAMRLDLDGVDEVARWPPPGALHADDAELLPRPRAIGAELRVDVAAVPVGGELDDVAAVQVVGVEPGGKAELDPVDHAQIEEPLHDR